MLAQVVLTPAESKRLIAKAVAMHEKVKKALENGIIAISHGSTNAYVLEELAGMKLKDKSKYVAGVIIAQGACVVPREKRINSIVIERGVAREESVEEAVKRMGKGDVLIKGANLIDSNMHAGVMLGSEVGGTLGRVLGTVLAKGIEIIIPVSLEKYIPGDVFEISGKTGIEKIRYSLGIPCGVMPLPGELITELEAFKILSNRKVEASVIASGGISGAEGAKCFLLEGSEKELKNIFDVVKGIKGERGIEGIKRECGKCIYKHCPNNKHE